MANIPTVAEIEAALRTMRKWGFTVVQDRPGTAQTIDQQTERAAMVACALLGLEVNAPNATMAEVKRLAEVLVSTSADARELPQFQ